MGERNPNLERVRAAQESIKVEQNWEGLKRVIKEQARLQRVMDAITANPKPQSDAKNNVVPDALQRMNDAFEDYAMVETTDIGDSSGRDVVVEKHFPDYAASPTKADIMDTLYEKVIQEITNIENAYGLTPWYDVESKAGGPQFRDPDEKIDLAKTKVESATLEGQDPSE